MLVSQETDGEFGQFGGGRRIRLGLARANLAVGEILEEGALRVEAKEPRDAVGRDLSRIWVIELWCGGYGWDGDQ